MFLGLDSFQTGIAGVCLLIVLVLLGVRVFIAAAIVGFLGLLELKGWRVAAPRVRRRSFENTGRPSAQPQ